ncbi:hypothetical protein MY942_08820, partial [Haemophilus influenzae]
MEKIMKKLTLALVLGSALVVTGCFDKQEAKQKVEDTKQTVASVASETKDAAANTMTEVKEKAQQLSTDVKNK